MENQANFINKIIKILVRNKAIEQDFALTLPQLFKESPQDLFEGFLLEQIPDKK